MQNWLVCLLVRLLVLHQYVLPYSSTHPHARACMPCPMYQVSMWTKLTELTQ